MNKSQKEVASIPLIQAEGQTRRGYLSIYNNNSSACMYVFLVCACSQNDAKSKRDSIPIYHPLASNSSSLKTFRLPMLEPDIASLALLPLSPRNLIRLFEISDPSLRVEQRTRPARFVQHAAELAQAACGFVAVVDAIGAESDSLFFIVFVICRDEFPGGSDAF